MYIIKSRGCYIYYNSHRRVWGASPDITKARRFKNKKRAKYVLANILSISGRIIEDFE